MWGFPSAGEILFCLAVFGTVCALIGAGIVQLIAHFL